MLQLRRFLESELYNIQFTPRERDCLHYLLQGYTAKEIGNHLQLSPRTIEDYIARLKEKLRCTCRSDLVKKAKDWELLET